MREIQLANNRGVALIDDADYDLVSKYKWYLPTQSKYPTTDVHDGYYKQKKIRMHNLILLVPYGMETDHINHNRSDNRRCNLRLVTHLQNTQNVSLRKQKKSSKYKGVCWYKRDGMWRAYIGDNGQHIHIGYFDTEIEAAKAYNENAKIRYGEYACLNEI